jgi:cytochrome c553
MMQTRPTLCALLAAVALLQFGAADAVSEHADELAITALELDAHANNGAKLFRDHCASCHGKDAWGDPKGDIPALAAQRRAYIVKQLADFSVRDRVATQMHQIVQLPAVSDPQAWADLSAYLNNLPPPRNTQTGDGAFLSLGEASYVQFCGSCHEDDGRGDDDGYVPSVRNQHYDYLLKEMRNLALGHRFNVENDLVRFLSSLESDEMQGIADYMSRMRGPVRDRARMNSDGTVND